MEEEQLIESRQLRDQMSGRFEVLEKVKELLLIPETDYMTVTEVADYYSTYFNDGKTKDNVVTSDGIRKLYELHKDELDPDGVCIKGYKDFLIGNKFTLEKYKGKVKLTHETGFDFEVPNRGIRVFPRRAILRIGMLLRDSIVAKEVRSQLLNAEEKTSIKTKTEDIDTEQSLMMSVGMAVASGDATAVAIATAKMIEFKNRHIAKLEQDNKALAGKILDWGNRGDLNAGIRMLSARTGIPFGKMWGELYKELQYKHGICLKTRNGGKKPWINNIKESEWEDVLKTFCGMCEAYKESPTEMFQKTVPTV